MASIRPHDLEALRAHLTRWLATTGGLEDAAVGELRMPETGSVNDTFLYTVTWRDADGRVRSDEQVLRANPAGFSNLRDHDALQQARFLERLGSRTGLPVPEVLWIDEEGGAIGRPFFVMRALPGQPAHDMPPYHLTGWLHDASVAQRGSVYRQAIEALAAVHVVEWWELGAEQLEGWPRSAAEALDRQVAEFVDFARWGAGGADYPTLDAAAAWLQSHQPQPAGPAVLSWNDGRLGNMLFDRFELTALLDWELASVGPPELDLSWLLWHDRFSAECLARAIAGRPVTRLEGSPSSAEGADLYARAAAHAPQDLDWYEAWAAYRMAVYLMRHGRGLIEGGLAPAESAVDRVNVASLELARMLDLEPPAR